MVVDWVKEKEKQRQIEKDIRRIKEKQKKEFLVKQKQPKPSSSKKKFQPTLEERKRLSILYTGKDRIEVKKGKTPIQIEKTVRKQRAKDIIKKVQVKQTLQALGRPEGYVYPVSMMPSKLDVQRKVLSEVKKDPTYQDKEFISRGQEERIKKLIKREERLGVFKQAVYERTGLARKEGEIYLVGFAKTAGQFPVELATLPLFLGGRASFAVESAFSEVGRSELVRARKETPKVIAQSYDIRKPEGLFNIALTGLAIKSIGKARVKARQKPTFMTEELVTKRTTTKGFTVDESFVDVETIIGKKKVSVKGRGTQTYEKLPSGEYGIKGIAELTEMKTGKVTKIDTRGIGIKKKGGFDVVSSTKVKGRGKTTFFEDVTLSAEKITQPTQVFDTLSITKEIGKPSRVTSGVTGEIYIEQLGGKGESMFRKVVKGESGRPIAIEQIMASDRFSISAEQFKAQFKGIGRTRDYSRMFKERESFRPVTTGKGGVTITKQIVELKGMPGVGGQILKQVAKTEAVNVAQSLKSAQVSKSVSTGIFKTSGLSIATLEKGTQEVSMSVPQQYVPQKPVTEARPVTKVLPKSQEISIIKSRTRPMIDVSMKPMVKTLPKLKQQPYQETKLKIGTRQIISSKVELSAKQAVKTQPMFRPVPSYGQAYSFKPTPTPPSPAPFILPPPIAGQLYLPESTGRPFKAKGKVKTKYTPSVEALIFDIRTQKLTKGMKIQALTGLGLRPIKL
jgi:hypothetical protein